jgi:hypothetical protein
MAAAKMQTAAEKYRQIKNDRLAQETLHDFESPSGMVWKLRRPNMAQFVATGVIPMQLAAKLAKHAQENGGDDTAAFLALDWDDQVKTIEMTNKIVRYCTVDPRIVETASAPNEIGFDEVELDDYNALAMWAMGTGGVSEAENLDTFRSE